MADRPRAGVIDSRLHAERVDPRTRRQLTRPSRIGELPDGVMVRRESVLGLWFEGSILSWSFAGYGAPITVAPNASVELLTPPATVATIAAGYIPRLHPSAHTPWNPAHPPSDRDAISRG